MNQRPSVPGFLWQVTTEDAKEYWLITTEEEYPAWLPDTHYAECWGGGMIFADVVENAKIEYHGTLTVVKTFQPDQEAIDGLLAPQRSIV
jgi:hypothetical protein